MPASTIMAGAPRLLVPVRLPERLDGTRLEHLSASSLARFWRCPESWRAHYLARVRGPESPDLRRGWAVDSAIDAHYRAILDTGEPLPRHDIEDLYTAECVGATSMGGTWEMSQTSIDRLLSLGWRSPEESTREFDSVVPNFDMYVALTAAPTLAELLVETLRHLGAQPQDLTLQTSQ